MKYIMSDKFKKVYDVVKSYIKFCNNSEEQINIYVSNYFIAHTFLQYLIHCELEDKYPEEYKNSSDNYDLRISDDILELFNTKLLKENGKEEVERVYQTLREKKNKIRNWFKLANIEVPREMAYKTHSFRNDLISMKIKIKK
jgi:hypothetical protein